MKNVISCSRRTDIPAFYYDWLQSALKAGHIVTQNPLYPENEYDISLSPDDVSAIVLWSKNFAPFIKNVGELENFNLYFQYTITGYSRLMEPNIPSYEESMKTLEKMLGKYNPEAFNIRFDPIILSTKGEVYPTPEKPGKARLIAFERLCKDLHTLGMDNCRLTTSYISLYGDTEKKLQKSGIDYLNLSESVQIEFMKRMAEIADKYNRDIYTCANDKFLGIPNIKKGHCIDGDLLSDLFPDKFSKAKDQGQRKECGCHKSIDIGAYQQSLNKCANYRTQKCPGNCRYCYASKE